MSKQIAARTAQWPLIAEFTFNAEDTMVATNGVETSFNANITTDVIPLPVGAVVIGGEVVVDTVYGTTGTATIDIGDADTVDRYADGVDLKSAARTGLTLTGYRYDEHGDLRVTIAVADSPGSNAGKVSIRVMYIIEGRGTEVNV